MRVITLPFQGLLFDLDGTLVNSLPAVERAWSQWSIENGLNPDEVVPKIHGRRAIDSIAILAPHLDLETAFRRLEHLEATDTDGVVPIAGAIEFIDRLTDIPWGIVTSGTSAIAAPRLKAAGIPRPDVFVAGEDVSEGKPSPAPFLEGQRRLGIPADAILAFEDTVAGVKSARAAGMKVVSLTEEAAPEADASIADYSKVVLYKLDDGRWSLSIP